MTPVEKPYYPGAFVTGQYYLFYFDYHQPVENTFDLPADAKFEADLIDPWKMTVTQVDGAYSGKTLVKLPGRPYHAIQFRKVV